MEIAPQRIPDVLLLKPRVFPDGRGYFFESFNRKTFENLGLNTHYVQDNESRSSYGVIRGLHYQTAPYAQAKLVRVVLGEILDVAVDIRPDSPTYGQHVSARLSADNHHAFYVPRGCAHGFSVLSPEAVVQYKCDAFWHPEAERGIRYDAPELAIDWQIPPDSVILSEKDKKYGGLADAQH